MKRHKKFDQYISFIFVITILIIVTTSYFTFKEVFVRSTQKQQEAIMPLFSLITSEIIRPITISQYMASDPFLLDYIQQDTIDEAVIFNYITSVSKKFHMKSFIAMEKHQWLIDSENKQISLNDEKVEWYHRLKAKPETEFTDFGDAENPHLFFDVKMFNQQQEFLGFIGLAVDLDHFATQFTIFKKDYGFELYFVDKNDQITLSSSSLMKTTFHHRRENITNINELAWYQNYQNNKNNKLTNLKEDNTDIFNSANENFIVSQMPLKDLSWRVFIVAPQVTDQNAYWQLFIRKLIIFLLVSFSLYLIFIFAIRHFKKDLVKDSGTDFLTKLPNRGFIHWAFLQLNDKHQSASVVIADVDNFKVLNDTYGHAFGDDVLKIIAKKLSENLRSFDLVGRWGGEEFIFIFPDTNAQQARDIIDRIRQNIADITFKPESTSKKFHVTVSFGISECELANSTLEEALITADQALYSAKTNGRNKVVIYH